MKTTIAAILLSASAASAQIYGFEQEVLLGFGQLNNTGSFSGFIDIAPQIDTASITGVFSTEPLTGSGNLARVVRTGGQTYIQILSYQFSSSGFDEDYSIVGLHPQLGRLDILPVNVEFSHDISVSYTMTENGANVGSGAGTFSISGGPQSVWVNTVGYPNDANVSFPSFTLDVSNNNVPPAVFPHGGPLSIPVLALAISVPEPESYAMVAGLGLVGFLIRHRFRK